MKKIFLLIMALVMSFALVACGENNDENNAAMQAKLDEADALVEEISTWYEDNGYLEGDTAAQLQPIVDMLRGQIAEMKADHKEILDKGGYTDEDVAKVGPLLDKSIVEYKKAKDEQIAYAESAASGTGIGALGEKYNQLVDIVNEASAKAAENGWEEYEAFTSEQAATFAFLEEVQAGLNDPNSIDETLMNELLTAMDEMIPVWQDYSIQVSEPYVAK